MSQFRWIFSAIWIASGGQAYAATCPSENESLLFNSCTASTHADLLLIAPDATVPSDLAGEDKTTLVVTGAYTSGEKVEPEGFVIDHGKAYDPYIQGWDGLLLITSKGELSLHHVSRVRFRGSLSNLRDRGQRRAFVARAKQLGLSAIQSHLLITDGALDVRDVSGAPSFRRRIVFSYKDGGFGIFDSGTRALTLFEAASEVADLYDPDMAFNLDMGSYDYCTMTADGTETNCGDLSRAATRKLSNILVFTQD